MKIRREYLAHCARARPLTIQLSRTTAHELARALAPTTLHSVRIGTRREQLLQNGEPTSKQIARSVSRNLVKATNIFLVIVILYTALKI
jgi:hypothetical protein